MKKISIIICVLIISLLVIMISGCNPAKNSDTTGQNTSLAESTLSNNSTLEQSVTSSDISSNQNVSTNIQLTSSDNISSETVSVGIGDNVFVDDWEF